MPCWEAGCRRARGDQDGVRIFSFLQTEARNSLPDLQPCADGPHQPTRIMRAIGVRLLLPHTLLGGFDEPTE